VLNSKATYPRFYERVIDPIEGSDQEIE